MGVDANYKDIPHQEKIALTLVVVAALLAPMWFVFQFDRALYDKLQLINLVLLCACIGFPLLILNVFVITIPRWAILSDGSFSVFDIMHASTNTMLVLYFPCINTFSNFITTQNATRAVMIGQILVAGSMSTMFLIKNFHKGRKAKKHLKGDSQAAATNEQP